MYNTLIASYYKKSAWMYKYVWYSSKSLGLHYGFWEDNTKNHDEALINQYKQIIDKARIKAGMKVLDAGCGVGGGSIYIAEHTGANVTGVTITKEQVLEAQMNAKRLDVDELVQFMYMDYAKTIFPNEYFDVVFAVESACYSYPKKLFLDEAYRVLKKGGTLIINDGYSCRKPKNYNESQILKHFCEGWKLRELIEVRDMTGAIETAGFRVITIEDKTLSVRASLVRMAKILRYFKPIIFLAKHLKLDFLTPIYDNALSMEMSIKGVDTGLMGYFRHTAKK